MLKELEKKAMKLVQLPEFMLDSTKYKGSGAVGRWIEEYFGVDENNLKNADYKGIELKSHSMRGTKLTLFTQSPEPEKITKHLLENFGYPRKELLKFFTTIYNSKYNRHMFKTSFQNKKIFLISPKFNMKIFWNFNVINTRIKEKINKLLLIGYRTRRSGDDRYIKIADAHFYNNFVNFYDFLKDDKIVIESRIQANHDMSDFKDRGWAFRTHIRNLEDLYKEAYQIG